MVLANKTPAQLMTVIVNCDELLKNCNKLQTSVGTLEEVSDEIGQSFSDVTDRIQQLRGNAMQQYLACSDLIEKLRKADLIELDGVYMHRFDFDYRIDITKPESQNLMIVRTYDDSIAFTVDDLQSASSCQGSDGKYTYFAGGYEIRVFAITQL